MPKKRRILRKIISFLIIVCVVVISYFAGIYSVGKNKYVDKIAEEEVAYVGEVINKYSAFEDEEFDEDVDFELFWDVWDSLKATYIDGDELSDKKLFYGALKGMINSVGDPYTVYMEPKISKEFQEDLAGTFEGIGAEIGIKKDVLTIIAPLPDMPAEKAGLKAGDKVLAIDGESTQGISIDEAVNKIRGEKGTIVTLSIMRNDQDLEDIDIKRGKIVVSSINTEVTDENYLIIKVSNFNNDTEELFSKAVREAIDINAAGIILDLRNNPGGYLETAIEMASEWVEDGIIVVEEFSDEAMRNEHLARGRARLKDFSTIVLVNKGSASASEIVSGALQDHDKALIVGEQSFGKGSVQTVEKFNDGSSLKVTIAKWLTPNGRSINDEGISPDLEVAYTVEDYQNDIDPQLDAAKELIANGLDIDKYKQAHPTEEEEIATSTEEEVINE